jgi:glycosyltransferase involved in cell wall biosynthesis
MRPVFSIVTVILNPTREDLMATLQSVLDQDCGDWELIIKDGGSSESTLAAIPQDPRIRIIRSRDNGVFDAMNQSLEHARGEWVCFLNAGDFFPHRKSLAMIVDYARRDEAIEFLYTDVAKPSSRSGYERYPDQLRRAYLFSHMICHQAWFVRSSYYQRAARYETKEVSGADRRFLLRMVLVDTVAHCHVPYVLVTYKGGGISQRPDLRVKAEQWIDEMLRELYSDHEYCVFMKRLRRMALVKRWLYDTGAWRLLRLSRSFRSDKAPIGAER